MYFVWDQDELLRSETPDWVSIILSMMNATKLSAIEQAQQAVNRQYSENQQQAANFDSLYIDLSSLIHYITKPFTTRIPEHIPKHIHPTPDAIKKVDLQRMEEQLDRIDSFYLFCRSKKKSLQHPLIPIIRAYLEAWIPEVEPDRRKTQIAPGFLKDSQLEASEANLPAGQFHEGGEMQGWLPGFENNSSVIVYALPLEIYESARDTPAAAGRGAPLDQRIFINALLAHPYGERQRDGSVKLTTSLRDIRDWIYPNGWTRKYDLPRIIRALDKVHNRRIQWARRKWNVVQVFGLPDSDIKLNDPLPLRVEYPEGVSGNGAMIDVMPLRLYGTNSAPKFRAWIRLAYIWDEAKIKSGGFRIYAKRPEVLRNSDGYLINRQGEVICTGDLYLTGQGWKFRQGNIPQKKWYHPLAVVIGEERNPEVDKVPVLSDRDMMRLFFDNQTLTPGGGVFRKRLHDARNAAEEMHKEGRIVVETDQVDAKRGIKGWRILQQRPE